MKNFKIYIFLLSIFALNTTFVYSATKAKISIKKVEAKTDLDTPSDDSSLLKGGDESKDWLAYIIEYTLESNSKKRKKVSQVNKKYINRIEFSYVGLFKVYNNPKKKTKKGSKTYMLRKKVVYRDVKVSGKHHAVILLDSKFIERYFDRVAMAKANIWLRLKVKINGETNKNAVFYINKNKVQQKKISGAPFKNDDFKNEEDAIVLEYSLMNKYESPWRASQVSAFESIVIETKK